jgi:predicted CopG family antitoxin
MEKKTHKTSRGVSMRDDAYSLLLKAQLELQQEKQDPRVAISDVIINLVSNANELKELKKQGLAK